MSLIKTYFWVIISLGLTRKVLAEQGEITCTGGICNPITSRTFMDLVSKISEIVLMIGIPVAVMFIIYAGFLFVTARGSEEKVTKARQTFTWAIIGTAILLGAKIIAMAVEATIKSL